MNLDALFQLTYGLYLITARHAERAGGCMANTLTQVTAEPPQLCVALSKQNYTTELILRSGQFCATVLNQSVDRDVIGTFGFRSGREWDKFASFATQRDSFGIPYLPDVSSAQFSCRVVHTLDLDTHLLFVGQLEYAQRLSDVPVLTYTDYRQIRHGTTPQNAPSYQQKH